MNIKFTDENNQAIKPEILSNDDWYKIQKAEDAIIYVNKQKIKSKSNVIEAGGLKIKLLSQPKTSEQKTFDITIIHDSGALYQQFLQLATAYNEYAKFAAEQRFEIIDSKTGASKPAPNAVLGKEYSTIFNQIDL